MHIAKPFKPRSHRLMATMCLALLASGCAGMHEVTSKVSSYGAWPEDRKPGAYVFERLPSQQNQAALQDQLEAAAEPALTAAGFHRVPDDRQTDAGVPDVSVQVASQVHVDARPRYDPFWGPYGAYGPYGPWGRPGWGGWWGSGGRGGVSFSMAMEPPYVQMEVSVLIRDRRSNQVLYETHAVHDRVGAADVALYPFLFEAALKDFPHQAVSPRAVTVPIPPDQP